MIRSATRADVPRLVAMGARFRAESAYADLVDDNPAQIAATFTALIDGDAATVLVADGLDGIVGLLALVLAPHHFSGERTAGEVIWWAEPTAIGVGLALWRAGERWAAEAGAVSIQMIAPATAMGARVGRLYRRRGYQPIETSYQAPVTAAMTAITVVDDVLPDVAAYRTRARAQRFGDVEVPAGVFHGIAPPPDDTLRAWIAARWPELTPTLSFLRQSPAGQVEPTHRHTDADMGDWTAILYLTADPPAGDGTTFWRAAATGALAETGDGPAWDDPTAWAPWTTVAARENRLVLFPAAYYHSRALPENYGTGETARLIQVTFGTGAL